MNPKEDFQKYFQKSVLPDIRTGNIAPIIRELNIQKWQDISKVTRSLSDYLRPKMSYDGINFAVFKSFWTNKEDGGFINNLSQDKIKISPDQKKLLIHWTTKQKLDCEKDESPCHWVLSYLADIEKIAKSPLSDDLDIIDSIIQSPTIQKAMRDGDFATQWSAHYQRKSIAEIIKQGVANCKIMALMARDILLWAHAVHDLGINRITIVEQNTFHVILKIQRKNGTTFTYDPSEIFYSP